MNSDSWRLAVVKNLFNRNSEKSSIQMRHVDVRRCNDIPKIYCSLLGHMSCGAVSESLEINFMRALDEFSFVRFKLVSCDGLSPRDSVLWRVVIIVFSPRAQGSLFGIQNNKADINVRFHSWGIFNYHTQNRTVKYERILFFPLLCFR